MAIADTLAPHARSLLRIIAAFLFMAHGTQKLFGTPVAEPRDPVELLTLVGAAGILEAFGGRRDGGGVLPAPLTAELLADPQRRRAGGALQLPVPVPVRDRRWSLEPGRVAAEVAPALTAEARRP